MSDKITNSIIATLLIATSITAGEVQGTVGWITGLPSSAELSVNNDDFTGELGQNPNKITLNAFNEQFPEEDFTQSLYQLERIIPTTATGGVTEYALSIDVGYHSSEGTLDTKFALELGFGTGDNFVAAADVAPQLVFDTTNLVSPPIPNYAWAGPNDPYPIFAFHEHHGDTVIYQGSSTGNFGDGFLVEVGSFFESEVFRVPLDVPDLPASARDYYSTEELAGLSNNSTPFTVRVTPVPEPTTFWILASSLLACGSLRSRHK